MIQIILEDRGYFVSIGNYELNWTVSQGSILAPLLFNVYMIQLGYIIWNNITYHSYEDDIQIYLSLSPNDFSPLVSNSMPEGPQLCTI